MATVGKAELKKQIHAILKKADLSTTTAKKVRQQLEDTLGVDLSNRRKEIDKIVMSYVNSQDEPSEEEDGEDDESGESEEDKKSKPAKRAAPPKKVPAKKPKKDSDEESASEESAASEEYKPNKKAAPKKKGGKKKGSESDSDSDWGKNKKAAKKGGGRGKGTGYTREYKLSPELAELMGKDAMPRHEVVKRVWAIIKERNLYDQNNKQFAICDEDLLKVFGTKRFRTFGMMKYLKTHFHD